LVTFEEKWQAEHEIEKIIFGYAEAVDEGDFVRVAKFFQRGRIRVNGRESVYEGSDGVLEVFQRYTRVYEGIPSTRHVTTNLFIEVDESGKVAHARSYFTVLQARPELPLQVVIAGRYLDTFERIEGTWWLTDRLGCCDLVGNLEAHLQDHPDLQRSLG
jgi:hypothetical protein